MSNFAFIEFIGFRNNGDNYKRSLNPNYITGVTPIVRGKGCIIDIANDQYSIWTKESYYQVLARIKAAKEGKEIKAFGFYQAEKNKKENLKLDEDNNETDLGFETETVYWGFIKYAVANLQMTYVVAKNNYSLNPIFAKRFNSVKKARAYGLRHLDEDCKLVQLT